MSDVKKLIPITKKPDTDISSKSNLSSKLIFMDVQMTSNESNPSWSGTAFQNEPSNPYTIRFEKNGDYCYLIYMITGVNNWVFPDIGAVIVIDDTSTVKGAVDVSGYKVEQGGKFLVLPIKVSKAHKPDETVTDPESNQQVGEYALLSFKLKVIDKENPEVSNVSPDPSVAIGIGNGS